MKKIVIGILVAIVPLLVFLLRPSPQNHLVSSKPLQSSPTPSLSQLQIQQKSLFVPYWTVGDGLEKGYDTYVYFGITYTPQGVNTSEDGYLNLQKFVTSVPKSAKKLLVIRMIDNSLNEAVLQDSAMQKTLIAKAIGIAKVNSFDGIVLDFEYNALGFQSVIDSVTNLSRTFALSTHQEGLQFYQTIYGDSIYRSRPYDIGAIEKNVDGIFIMAYDFHKANGDPGPNFPLSGDEYNLQQMMGDFLKVTPADKITIIFGMFGYDWVVDSQQRSIKPAESFSTNEIMQKFITKCIFVNCVVSKNSSLETEITYKDTTNQQHNVWFEDTNSIQKKIDFVKKMGITSIGYWANGYF